MKRIILSVSLLIVSNSFSMHRIQSLAPRTVRTIQHLSRINAARVFSSQPNGSGAGVTLEDRKKELQSINKKARVAGLYGLALGSIALGAGGFSVLCGCSGFEVGLAVFNDMVNDAPATGAALGLVAACIPWAIGSFSAVVSRAMYDGAKEEAVDFKGAMERRKKLLELIKKAEKSVIA